MHDQERKLCQPEEEEGDHGRGVDALRCGYVIGECEERRPNCAYHYTNCVGTIHRLDCEPENRQDCSRDDGNVRAPETPAGACYDWEWNMVENTDGSIEGDDPGDDEEAQGDNAQAFSPCQSDSDDAGSELPSRCVERVRYPIRDEADDAPFPTIWRYRIKIFVCPMVSTKVSVIDL